MASQFNDNFIVPVRTRLAEFWKRNQIILMHLPFILLSLYWTYIVLKAIDPRIGLEGFGDLFGYLLNSVRLCLIIFTAWWMKKWLFFDLFDSSELELFEAAKANDPAAHHMLWRDRAEWLLLLSFATYWYTR